MGKTETELGKSFPFRRNTCEFVCYNGFAIAAFEWEPFNSEVNCTTIKCILQTEAEELMLVLNGLSVCVCVCNL